jgi:hypothetical protein
MVAQGSSGLSVDRTHDGAEVLAGHPHTPGVREQRIDVPEVREQRIDVPGVREQRIDVPGVREQRIDVPEVREQRIDVPGVRRGVPARDCVTSR